MKNEYLYYLLLVVPFYLVTYLVKRFKKRRDEQNIIYFKGNWDKDEWN